MNGFQFGLHVRLLDAVLRGQLDLDADALRVQPVEFFTVANMKLAVFHFHGNGHVSPPA